MLMAGKEDLGRGRIEDGSADGFQRTASRTRSKVDRTHLDDIERRSHNSSGHPPNSI